MRFYYGIEGSIKAGGSHGCAAVATTGTARARERRQHGASGLFSAWGEVIIYGAIPGQESTSEPRSPFEGAGLYPGLHTVPVRRLF